MRCKLPEDVHPRWLRIRDFVRALRFHTRWAILKFIGDGVKFPGKIGG